MPRELTHGIDFLFLFLKRQLRELDFRIRGYLIIKRIALFPDMNDALVIEKFNDNYKKVFENIKDLKQIKVCSLLLNYMIEI